MPALPSRAPTAVGILALGIAFAVALPCPSLAAQEPAPWFEGTIVERTRISHVPAALAGYESRTWFAPSRIRRESATRLAGLAVHKAGILVDLEKKEAILYQGDLLQKFYCRLTLDELAQEVARRRGTHVHTGREKGYNPVFLPLKEPYVPTTEKDAWTVLDRTCDRIVLDQAVQRWTVASCREIRVKEALVRAVFPNIPQEVTGYPLRVVYEVLRRESAPDPAQLPAWLAKALSALEKVNAFLSVVETWATEIRPGKAPDDAFTLDASYGRVGSLAELEAKFPEGDFDD